MMGGLVLANGSSIVGAGTLSFSQWNNGSQGVLFFEASPVGGEVQLVCKSISGSSINVATSKAITSLIAVGPLYLPAGEYAIRLVASSAIGVRASIHPTR